MGSSLNEQGLFVRVQNNASTNGSSPYSVSPSFVVYSKMENLPLNLNDIQFAPITSDSIVIQPPAGTGQDKCGDEDPRIVYREKDGLYYLLYTQWDCSLPRLSLATTKTPNKADGWQFYGPIFPDSFGDTKSGSMLIRDDVGPPHYLYWGDGPIRLATSTDLIHWTNVNNSFIGTRSDSFDSALVEGGPLPLRMSDGNYLMIYNSARGGYPSDKPGWNLQYNVGYVVLDYNDPTKIITRSSSPILSPELAWEKEGFTPNVVFLEGWYSIGKDTFLAFYGGADQDVGAAVVSVTIS